MVAVFKKKSKEEGKKYEMECSVIQRISKKLMHGNTFKKFYL